jgi:uncharacterized damage-inducible protein DinB
MEIQNISTFLEYLDRVHERTMRVVRCIPPDGLDWTFRAGKFTLGDLLRHMALMERQMFAETVRGNKSRYAGCGPELAASYDDVVALMEGAQAETREIVSALSPQDLQRKCITPDGAPITTWKWLRAMVEHEIHHRGQIYTYLAMLGIETPPLFGLTSEQVRDRSASAGNSE